MEPAEPSASSKTFRCTRKTHSNHAPSRTLCCLLLPKHSETKAIGTEPMPLAATLYFSLLKHSKEEAG